MTEPINYAAILASLLSSLRVSASTESKLQQVLEDHFSTMVAWEIRREYPLSRRDRVDFFFRPGRIGLEVKVDGTTNAVMRQLARYAESDDIEALVLLTTQARHRSMPNTLRGKPVRVVFTGRTAL